MVNLEINGELTEKIITNFIVTEVRKFGFQRVLLGLSGGVDSALSAYLGARALGPENVFALLMPYKTSSPDSVEDALSVVKELGIGHEIRDITPQIDAYFEHEPAANRTRRGNKMARERMSILYDYSVARESLVLGTSNKTEALLGYTTLWGDMASALNPLGDLYKTQVRQLARATGVPARIIEKPPSADLWAGQTDEDDLTFTYEEADRVLYLVVDLRCTIEDVMAEGFDDSLVRRIIQRVRDNEYKRKMPIVAKVSQRTIGRDFRYSRDWGH